MDDFVGGIVSAFFSAIGYLLADIFYGTICYWVGWPICKILTLGKYPKSKQAAYTGNSSSGAWCSAVGLVTLVASFYYYILVIYQ